MMSRSRKKEPYYSCKPGSFKAWKKEINGEHRARCRQALRTCEDWDTLLMPDRNKKYTLWDSPKDGCSWRNEKPQKDECLRQLAGWMGYPWSYKRMLKEIEETGHLKRCNCIDNKNGTYWKVLRK
jgi:hypothetical protein